MCVNRAAAVVSMTLHHAMRCIKRPVWFGGGDIHPTYMHPKHHISQLRLTSVCCASLEIFALKNLKLGCTKNSLLACAYFDLKKKIPQMGNCDRFWVLFSDVLCQLNQSDGNVLSVKVKRKTLCTSCDKKSTEGLIMSTAGYPPPHFRLPHQLSMIQT